MARQMPHRPEADRSGPTRRPRRSPCPRGVGDHQNIGERHGAGCHDRVEQARDCPHNPGGVVEQGPEEVLADPSCGRPDRRRPAPGRCSSNTLRNPSERIQTAEERQLDRPATIDESLQSVALALHPTVRVRMVSSTRLSLTRMPLADAAPTAAVMASGVASPSAQGHAMTTTAMARIQAMAGSCVASIQAAKASTAIPMTAGTKARATWSTVRSISHRVPKADSTVWMIRASVLSAPTRVARTCVRRA